MSAPIIWIAFPFLVAISLLFLLNKKRLVWAIALGVCLLLALLAIFQEIGEVLKIGFISIEIRTSIQILGRSFTLSNTDRFFLSFVYVFAAFWFAGSRVAKTTVKFIPLGLATIASLTAALAVEPFLYSAIFVEAAALITLPLMIEPGKKIGKGVIRFIIFQFMAMPFILFGGWLLGGIQASPSDINQLSQATVFLAIGFAFWLAVFPLQSWVPQLSTDIHPYVYGFILGIFPIVTLLIMIDFISGLVWLRESQILGPTLRLVGLIMVITSGIWSLFEKDLRRIIGYSILFENGFALILLSFQSVPGIEVLYASFIPRLLALAVVSMCISIMVNEHFDTNPQYFSGILRKFPIAGISLFIGLLSIAGFPLLGGFPARLSVFELTAEINPLWLIPMVIGVVAYFISILKIIYKFIIQDEQRLIISESITQIILLFTGIFGIVLFGIVPGIIYVILKVFFLNLPILR